MSGARGDSGIGADPDPDERERREAQGDSPPLQEVDEDVEDAQADRDPAALEEADVAEVGEQEVAMAAAMEVRALAAEAALAALQRQQEPKINANQLAVLGKFKGEGQCFIQLLQAC